MFVSQLFIGDSSHIHVSWTEFNQYLTRPLTHSHTMTSFDAPEKQAF